MNILFHPPSILPQEGLTPSLRGVVIPPAAEPLETRCSGVAINGGITHALGCEWEQGPAPNASHGVSPSCFDLTLRVWRLAPAGRRVTR